MKRKPYGEKASIDMLKNACQGLADTINESREVVDGDKALNCWGEYHKVELEDASYDEWYKEYRRLYRKAWRYNLNNTKQWG